MKKSLLLLAAMTLVTGLARAQEQGPVWFADYDQAAASAKKQNKDILVDFTGSDWCGWCMKLDKEVFDHESFLTEARKHYVLLKLDFPRGEEAKAKVPNPARNDELQEKYGIQGFPSILLMDADGEVFGQTGYQEGGPEAYLKHMDELATKGKKALETVKALEKEFAAAEGDKVAAVVEKAVAYLEKADEETVGLITAARIARKAFEIDAKDEKGLKTRTLKALLKSGQASDEDRATARAADPKNEKGLLEHCIAWDMNHLRSEEEARAIISKLEGLIAMGVKDAELRKMVYANTAYFALTLEQDQEKAKKYGKMLKDLPDLDSRFDRLITMIFGEEGK